MKTFRSPRSMQRWATAQREAGKRIALVPTMGALHEGHLALIRTAAKTADMVIVSIFVNPAQFGPNEDYTRYPRRLSKDKAVCRAEGVAAVFTPAAADMYDPTFSTWVNETSLSQALCGLRRPGHFKGVCTIVLKLLLLCQAQATVFGQKDAQQTLVIRRMIRDLNIPVRLILHPTVREEDGLALSSRNRYLTEKERHQAPILYEGLSQVASWKEQGQTPAQIRRKLTRHIQTAPEARIDYVSIVDEETMETVKKVEPGQKLLIAVAVFFGKTRLIDNTRIEW